jgi:hypothetical protein
VTSYTEVWDRLAKETLRREYERHGVREGDHLGYFLKRTGEQDKVFKLLRRIRT